MNHPFNQHWKNFGTANYNAAKLRVAGQFLAPLLASLNKGSYILDVGCGDGIHAQVIRSTHSHVSYIGIDIADISHSSTECFSSKRFRFVRCDALKLPFADNVFDAVFSFGVLGYTPQPKQGFAEMHRVLKPGGFSGIWLYPRQAKLSQALHAMCRIFLNTLPAKLARMSCYALAPLLWVVPTKSNVSLSNSTWRECAEIVAVNLLYPVQFFTDKEVEAWHRALRFSSWSSVPGAPITVYAVK